MGQVCFIFLFESVYIIMVINGLALTNHLYREQVSLPPVGHYNKFILISLESM